MQILLYSMWKAVIFLLYEAQTKTIMTILNPNAIAQYEVADG